jgi:hypothetical protein
LFFVTETKLLRDPLQPTASSGNQICALRSLTESHTEVIERCRWLFRLWCIVGICFFGGQFHIRIVITCIIGLSVVVICELGNEIVQTDHIVD